MDNRSKPKCPEASAEVEPLVAVPAEAVAGGVPPVEPGLEIDPDLVRLLPWAKVVCCEETWYRDPQSGKLHAINGDPNSAAHELKGGCKPTPVSAE